MMMHKNQSDPPKASLSVLGQNVAALSSEEAVAELQCRLDAGVFTPVAFLNSHVANISAEDAAFAAVLRKFLVLPDGIGVDIAAWMKHGRSFPSNLNGTDFIPRLLKHLRGPLHIGLVGAKEAHLLGACKALTEAFPEHRFTAYADGYSKTLTDGTLIERLHKDRPEIVLVAIGVPAQEKWIFDHLDSRCCTLAFGVGALFDFLSGAVPRAPSAVRMIRSEWLWRLAMEPRRLFGRYVLGNPRFLYRVWKNRKEA